MIKKILVPLDGSELAEGALPYASELATALDATLTLLGVAPTPRGRRGGVFKPVSAMLPEVKVPETPGDIDRSKHQISHDSEMASREAEVRRQIEPVATRLREKGLSVDVAVIYGRPSARILQYAQDEQIDLIVMSTHGSGGLKPYAFGRTADRVARRSSVPTTLIRPKEISKAFSDLKIGKKG